MFTFRDFSVKKIIIIIVISSIILSYLQIFNNFNSYKIVRNANFEFKDIPLVEKNERIGLDKGAYVFLGLGAQANQLNCNAAIESLVRHSGWAGDVYLITDKPYCFDEDEIINNSEINRENFHLVTVDGSFDGIDLSFDLRKNRKKSFQMKSKLFEYIKDPNILVIAYSDCDILFANKGCAHEFISHGLNWSSIPGGVKVSKLIKSEDGLLSDLHVGTLIAHREHSKAALKLWEDQLERNEQEDDNDAYIARYLELQRSLGTDESNPMMAEMVLREDGSSYEAFFTPPQSNILCMNHIAKSRCARYGGENIQNFVDRFKLRTYKDKYPYCVNPYFQPLLYSWFPFEWLPGCPKLEMYS